MDELLLSGKKHISARRAAKENGYASDYIGQLIRAGKLRGQKVGRAWYVDDDSLRSFTGKETALGSLASAASASARTPSSVPPIASYAPPPIARLKKTAPMTYIARSTPLFTYIRDEEALLPPLSEKAPFVPMNRKEEKIEKESEDKVEEPAGIDPLPPEEISDRVSVLLMGSLPAAVPVGVLTAALMLGLIAFSQYDLSYDADTQVSAASVSFQNPFK